MINHFHDESQDYDLDAFLEQEFKGLTKKGKTRKRKPKESRVYFTEETEDAILEYLSLEDQDERNKIYNEKIAHSFYKLVENIIHTFKFYYTDTDTIEELKHEVTTFLLEKLHLYHHSKNINDRLIKLTKEFGGTYEKNSFIIFTNNAPKITQKQIDEFILTLKVTPECHAELSKLTPPKAYSYFGTIAKRYLINYNRDNYEKLQEYAEIDEVNDEDTKLIDHAKDSTQLELTDFINQYIAYIDKHIYKLFPKTKDAQTADAIVELFRRRESLEIFNKKALYIYIREITDVETPQITKIIKKLKLLYAELYNEYYQHGHVNI